jgi:4-hydroxybenzoyl-CoA thioesterase
MMFTTEKLIRFHHCDPAGIVFYPQYFYLLHEAQEDLLAHIGHPEHVMIASGYGLPIVKLATDFVAMSRYGDTVQIDLSLTRLGRASLGMHYRLRCGEQTRLLATSTVVYVNNTTSQAEALPDALRAVLLPFLTAPEPSA